MMFPPQITPGTTLKNPVTGERFRFLHTRASPNGELPAVLASSYDAEAHAPFLSRTGQRRLLLPFVAVAKWRDRNLRMPVSVGSRSAA